jgi:hypothetical protein
LSVKAFKGVQSGEAVAVFTNSYVNDTVLISYSFTQCTPHSIIVRINGVMLPGSPLVVHVEPVDVFARAITAITNINFPILQQPSGLCSDGEELIYITDTRAGDVKVLNSMFNVQGIISKRGSGFGELDSPTGIAIDRHGNLVVCDTGNRRLQVFSVTGLPIRESSGNFHELQPVTIAVNSQNTYVVGDACGQVFEMCPEFKQMTLVSNSRASESRTVQALAVKTGFVDEIFVVQPSTGDMAIKSFRTGILEKYFNHHPPSTEESHGHEATHNDQVVQISDLYIDSAGNFVMADALSGDIKVYSYSGLPITSWRCPGVPQGITGYPGLPYHYIVAVTMLSGITSLVVYGPEHAETLAETPQRPEMVF